MPKKSAAELQTPKSKEKPLPRVLLPGRHVPEPAKAIFAEIVASVGEGHLQPVDRPLLEQLAVAIHVARELAAVIERDGVLTQTGKVSMAVRTLKSQQALIGQLCSRARLTPQNRISKDKARTTASQGGASLTELYETAR